MDNGRRLMGWKLFRALRWATDSTKPALNKSGALLFTTDKKRTWINTGNGWIGADTPPIGATYIQLPGKSDPATLWPSTTWSNISSETLLKGRVPRIEGTVPSGGGNVSASFGASQDDQMQGHTHGSGYSVANYVSNSAAGGSGYPLATSFGPIGNPTTDLTNGTPRVGSATRDASVTVRIWQRTA